jgi:hypothetical protein
MLDLQVGQALKVTMSEPAGDVILGEYVTSDENTYIVNVFARTPAEHWVILHREKIARIDRVLAAPVALGFFPGLKSAVGMGLSGGR